MKRFAWILGAAALASAALFALLVALLPRETLAMRVGQQISAWTGRAVSSRGEPEFDFFPRLTVTLKDVQVAGPEDMENAEVITMERLEGQIRIWPLIIGEVEIGAFTMVRPLIRLVREDDAKNWAFDSGAAALQLAFAGDVPLGEFRLEDGTVVYEDRDAGLTERMDSVNLNLGWDSVRRPIAFDGSGIWRGEQVSFSLNAATPFAFLNGDTTPVEARLDSAPIEMVFSGQASEFSDPQLSGNLAMTTPSLRGFAGWLGSPVGPGSTLGLASLAGRASFQDSVLSVDDAQFALDGNTANGALNVALSARPDITGTLAFPAIDLTPYFAGIASEFDAGRSWRDVEIATAWFRDFSADIRLSAGSVQLGPLRFGSTAASASLRDLRLEIGVAEAAFGSGSLAGHLSVSGTPDDADAAVAAQLRATGVELAEAAPALAIPSPLSGTAAATLDLMGSGRDLASLVRDMRGTASFDLQNGAFPTFGIAELGARGATATPQQIGLGTTTPVQALSAAFSFSGGVAVLEKGRMAAPSFSADAEGWIGLLDGNLSLNGTVHPPSGVAGAPVPFAIRGTLAQPVARPLALAN